VAVVLTTHILEVAEKLADRIGIIAHGQLIAEGDLNQLRALTAVASASLEDVFLDLTARGEAA
jgi:ABC-2 type transport system ATP-binding protein